MKHVKDFITERKIIAPYKKYREYLEKKYDSDNVEIYKNVSSPQGKFEQMYLSITKIFDPKAKEDILQLLEEMDSLGKYELSTKMWVSSGTIGLTFIVYDVTPEFMHQLDMEMEANKYNL